MCQCIQNKLQFFFFDVIGWHRIKLAQKLLFTTHSVEGGEKKKKFMYYHWDHQTPWTINFKPMIVCFVSICSTIYHYVKSLLQNFLKCLWCTLIFFFPTTIINLQITYQVKNMFSSNHIIDKSRLLLSRSDVKQHLDP